MNPMDPLRPGSLDDLVDQFEPVRPCGSYAPGPLYAPYQWEMPWIETPPPSVPRLDEPRPEPQQLPRYDDCLLTPDSFARAMRDLNG